LFLTIRGIEVVAVSMKIDELKPGMILAEPVYNQSGSLLLDKDTSLTKRRIWMLKTWGVDKVSVKGKPKEGGKTIIETELETKETIEKELRAKFEDTIDDPVMKIIMKAAARQLQKSLSDTDAQNKPS
jgi:molybdopterin biosynthesis enzyme